MTETVNFASIAEDVLEQIETSRTMTPDRRHALVVEALRLVWNARGSADVGELKDVFEGEVFVDDLIRRIKAIDRG